MVRNRLYRLVQSDGECLPNESSRGVSLIELVITIAIILVLTAVSLPSFSKTLQSFRGVGDARRIASMLQLTQMRAGAMCSRTRLNVNLAAGTFALQVYNRANNTWGTEGGTESLSPKDSFGFGTISTPAGGQTTITETPQIMFNSRTIPVDSLGSPTGSYANYLSNGMGDFYAVTVSITGQISIWQFNGSVWVKRN